MLKRIRKMSKQKASGKEQEEIAKSKADKTVQMKEAETTALLNERDSLLEEVKSLKEQLENENVRYTELKALKSQQVCALTFKLAKAMRDKERAVEKSEILKQKLQQLRNTKEEIEECDLEFRQSIPLESTPLEDSPRLPMSDKEQVSTILHEGKEGPCETMSFFAVIGEPTNSSKQDLVEKSCDGGESTREAEDMNSDCSSTHSTSQGSFKSDEQKRKVMTEFRRIQQELFDVKKNMSMVQALNERLSRDLQLLVDKKNSHPLARSESLRMRKNGSSDYGSHDSIDGKVASVFVFPDAKTIEDKGKTIMQDESTETENYDLDQSDGLQKKNEFQDERIESTEQKSLKKTPDEGFSVEFESAAVEPSCDDVKERQNNVVEVRKQLEKAMKELEELRTDNREMKEKIDKIASCSTDHDDFLRRTTRFTSLLLKEMREREQKIDRKMAKTMSKVEPRPLSILGIRLNEISKTVDDMTKTNLTPPPKEPVCIASSTPLPLESAFTPNPISRPQSAGLPTMQAPVFARQVNAEPKPAKEQKRRVTTGKLGEPSLAYKHVGRISNEVAAKRQVEPLAKEWRSTETLSPRSSFTGSLRYKDYIQRHIVMSSDAIAKIRDLTPEELSAHIY